MEWDYNARERLIEHPPGYDDVDAGQPREQFEVDDTEIERPEGEEENSRNSRFRWLYSVREFGKNNISVPARHLIDPIVNFLNGVSMWIDSKLSLVMNPLVARRIFTVTFACVIILLIKIQYGSVFGALRGLKDHDRLREALKSKLSLKNLQETSNYFGQMPHYAGSLADDSTSNYVHDYFESLGLTSRYDRNAVFISHGNTSLLELKQNGEVLWSSNMQEGQAIKDPNASQKQPASYMALALGGDVEAPLVYANFGSAEDLRVVDVMDKIVLVKFSEELPATVALRVEDRGAKGILFMAEKHTNEPSWPEGSDYPEDAIRQGSLGSPSIYPGDILSPGWPSSMQMTVDLKIAYIAHIPAAAVSWKDAELLLGSLKGKGVRMDASKQNWANNGQPKGVDEWWTGPNEEIKVHLQLDPVVEPRHEIRNVIGIIEGREMKNRAVIIGARLDAMCYGSSQLAGLNVMLEVARVLADLKYTSQWEPLRTIIFAAWDGTSFNYAGATEWVENVAADISTEGLVYIDLDLGVSGPDLVVQGNPIIEVEELLRKIAYQEGTLYDAVDKNTSFKPIPGYGNHIAFEAHTGIPSIRFGFQNNNKPVPVDSCFDNIEWMAKFGDPTYERHLALAEFLSYLVLELSDAPLIPFDFSKLGREIHRYMDVVDEEIKGLHVSSEETSASLQQVTTELRQAASDVEGAGMLYSQVREKWEIFARDNRDEDTGELPDINPVSQIRLYWNEKVAQANKVSLDRNGIAFRNWYKNHLFGPEIDVHKHKFAGVFPAVRDSLAAHSPDSVLETLADAKSHIEILGDYLSSILV